MVDSRIAADRLRVSTVTISKWASEGVFKSAIKLGRIWHFDSSEISEFAKKRPSSKSEKL